MGFNKSLKILGKNIEHYCQELGICNIKLAMYLNLKDSDIIKSLFEGNYDITLIELNKIGNLLNVELYDLFEPDLSKHNKEFKRISLKGLSIKDLKIISNFYEIIQNYIKLKK